MKINILFIFLLISFTASAQRAKNRIGVQIHNMKAEDQLKITNELHTKWSRGPGLELDSWKPTDDEWIPFVQDCQRVNVHINRYATNTTHPFPRGKAEINKWAQDLVKVLNTYDPRLPDNVSIENEELNQNYHSGPMSDYIAQLDTAVKILHAYNIRVVNGGLPEQVICQGVYRWLKYTKKNEKAANDWATATLTASQKKSADNYNPGTNIRRMDTCLDAYKRMDLDAVNIHIYYPWDKDKNRKPIIETMIPSNAFQIIAEYIEDRTGKKSVSNETSIRHESKTLMKNFFDSYNAGQWKFIIFNSSYGGSAGEISLVDPATGKLNEMGKYYTAYVDEFYGVPQPEPKPAQMDYKVWFWIVLGFLILAVVAIALLLNEKGKDTKQKAPSPKAKGL